MGGIDSPYVTLSCRIRMPAVGLGTWSLKGSAGIDAMLKALELGYRLLDTATYYRNEREVGEAVRQSGIPREEIFITTKIYPTEYGRPDEALEGSLDRLGLGYADMAMLHHPAADDLRAWGAIERAIAQGEARCGGLSCYSPSQARDFMARAKVRPQVVQNEIHPYFQDAASVRGLQDLGLAVQSWYPLGGRGHVRRILKDKTIAAIAQAHGVSPSQAVLRWELQRGIMVIPGSSDEKHLRENLDLFSFELNEDEMARMAALERGEKHGWA